jgi:ABC-type multidrug transport system ATPase subunit
LLLDEPFAALDPRGVEDICDLISSLDATVVIASHQVQRAGELCNKAMLLEEGQIRWKGDSVDGWGAYQRSIQDFVRE